MAISMTIGAGTTFGTVDTYDLTPVYDSNAKKFVINYKISEANWQNLGMLSRGNC